MNAQNAHAQRQPGGQRAGTSGFSLFAVLLAVAFMAGIVAAYGRHVIVAGRGGMSSPPVLATRGTCASALALARQSIASGQALPSTSMPVGGEQATILVTGKPNGHRLVSVQSLGQDGLGARRTIDVAVRQRADSLPDGPSSLPKLGATTVHAVMADATLPRIVYATSQRVEHAELTGLLVVQPGVVLQLADVVLHGAIVSSTVLSQATLGAYDAATAPRLVVDGNLRIDPPAALPGLAILMPDGAVTSTGVDARVQIQGDVVADVVSLMHKGSLSGHVFGEHVTLANGALLDRLGFDRKPPAWSSALDLGGAQEIVSLATVPTAVSTGSLAPLINYWKD